MSPRVTILVPTLNTAGYVTAALESIARQSERSLEVLCIDAGSTDGTREILKGQAAADDRFRVIDSPVRSYGAQLNQGLSAARGAYVGIVEPDDWVVPDMYALLLAAAERYDLDYAKADFIRFTGEGESCRETRVRLLEGLCVPYDKPLNPAAYPELVMTFPATWSGLYRRRFLQRIGFRYTETPGASFQDTGLHFASVLQATRGFYLARPLYYYRRDNAKASTYRQDACVVLRREFDLQEETLFPRLDPQCLERFLPYLRIARFKSELAAANRLTGEARERGREVLRERCLEDYRAGRFIQKRMRPGDWLSLVSLVEGPGAVSAWDRVLACYRENGPWYTLCRACGFRGKEYVNG